MFCVQLHLDRNVNWYGSEGRGTIPHRKLKKDYTHMQGVFHNVLYLLKSFALEAYVNKSPYQPPSFINSKSRNKIWRMKRLNKRSYTSCRSGKAKTSVSHLLCYWRHFCFPYRFPQVWKGLNWLFPSIHVRCVFLKLCSSTGLPVRWFLRLSQELAKLVLSIIITKAWVSFP